MYIIWFSLGLSLRLSTWQTCRRGLGSDWRLVQEEPQLWLQDHIPLRQYLMLNILQTFRKLARRLSSSCTTFGMQSLPPCIWRSVDLSSLSTACLSGLCVMVAPLRKLPSVHGVTLTSCCQCPQNLHPALACWTQRIPMSLLVNSASSMSLAVIVFVLNFCNVIHLLVFVWASWFFLFIKYCIHFAVSIFCCMLIHVLIFVNLHLNWCHRFQLVVLHGFSMSQELTCSFYLLE